LYADNVSLILFPNADVLKVLKESSETPRRSLLRSGRAGGLSGVWAGMQPAGRAADKQVE
jgi:hypothetical protein